jgi:hypothetical protein
VKETTRIVSIRVSSVARLCAVIYAALGLLQAISVALSDAATFTLPVGLVALPFHLNLNLNFPRPTGPSTSVLMVLALFLSYSVTGWLTGAALALCFNLIAKRTGGIDACLVTVTKENPRNQTDSAECRGD